MAVDAGLLSVLEEGISDVPTIRIYRWDRPAVSIGRHQSEEAVRRHYRDLPIVRRPTGGRAVLHGADLTISVAARTNWLPQGSGRTILSSYHTLMEPLAAALERAGQSVCYGEETVQGQGGCVDCFEISAACDLVDPQTRQKLVGSAQRRGKAALLQQMSFSLFLLSNLDHFLQCLQQEYAHRLEIHLWYS